MKIFGYRIMIVPERDCVQLAANIRRLRGERNQYKKECEGLRLALVDSIMQSSCDDLEAGFARLEAAHDKG